MNNDEPEISSVESPDKHADNASHANDEGDNSLFGGPPTDPLPADAPVRASPEMLSGDSSTVRISPAVSTGSTGFESSAAAPLRADGPAAEADRTTRVQGGPGAGWCPRCKAEVPTRGFCPVCGSQTGPPQAEKLLSGYRKLDVFLGFIYFWACYALTLFVPSALRQIFPYAAIILGLILFSLVPVTAIIVFTRPRFAYRAFGRGITYGAISFGVLILGALLTCIGLGVFGALRF